MSLYFRDLNSRQRANATTSLRIWNEQDGTPREAKALIEAEITESSIENLHYGDGTSLGILQLIASNGTVAQRLDVAYCVRWFLDGAREFRSRAGSAGDLAGWVQRPAAQYLYRYATHEAEADDIIDNIVHVAGPHPPPGEPFPHRPSLEPVPHNFNPAQHDYSELVRASARNHVRGGHYLDSAGRAIRSLR